MDTLLKNLSSLSVNKSSKHPNVADSSHIPTTDFAEAPESRAQNEAPLVTDVVVRHSSAFNSERASGMNKVQQLQFVEAVKRMMIDTWTNFYSNYIFFVSCSGDIDKSRRKDEAPFLFPTYTSFKIVTARKEKNSPASPTGFCSATVCVATLLGLSNEGGVVVEKSTECEFLADAVEDLWDRVGVRMGAVADGFKVGERVSGQADGEGIERVNSGETVVGSERESTQGESEGEEIKQDNKSGVTVVVTESER